MEVHDFPNYLIYEDGRIWSKNIRPCFLKGSSSNRYKEVKLYREDGSYKIFKLHRLLALHYIPNPNNYPQVDHIDRDKSNNHISNLRWVDASMNQQNTGIPRNNTSGIKNISYDKSQNRYIYKKTIRGTRNIKYFKSLEEATAYKSAFET